MFSRFFKIIFSEEGKMKKLIICICIIFLTGIILIFAGALMIYTNQTVEEFGGGIILCLIGIYFVKIFVSDLREFFKQKSAKEFTLKNH
jgi:hypothetical protein